MLLDESTFDRLCRARDLLGSSGPVSIPEVARATGMSTFHFIRRFEALFGWTPHQYRIRRRVDFARQLLASGGHSVTDTCFASGMNSLGSFSTQFAQWTGESPREFQKRARRGDDVSPGFISVMNRAFRNFQEAAARTASVECEHANQTDEPDGR
jgi:AraC-like DNA-binding protein